jgi:hypothetical protein
VKFTQNGKSPRNAAICCNWLQLAARGSHEKAKNAQNVRIGATGCDWRDEIWADTQVSPTGGDWVQFAATGLTGFDWV